MKSLYRGALASLALPILAGAAQAAGAFNDRLDG